MSHQRVFQIDRADPLSAGFDQVLGAIGNAHKAHGVNAGHIARSQPSIACEFIFAHGHMMVAARDEGASHLQLTHMLSIPSLILAFVVADAQINQRHWNTGHGSAAVALIHRRIAQFGLGVRNGADGRSFGHAPALQNPDAMFVKCANEGFRHCGTAHQTAHTGR